MNFATFLIILLSFDFCFACMMGTPLSGEMKEKADLVFVGVPIKYAPSKMLPNGNGLQPAEITFEIKKTIKGKGQKIINVQWINGTFGESASLDEFKKKYGSEIRVGVATPDAFKKFVKCEMMKSVNALTGKGKMVESCRSPILGMGQSSKDFPNKPWLVQGPCSPPYMKKIKSEISKD